MNFDQKALIVSQLSFQIITQMESKVNEEMMDRLRLELNPCRKGLKKEAMFVICSFDSFTERCLQVTVRRVLQVEYLIEYMTDKHGGHIIPVLELYNIFKTEVVDESDLFKKIGEYLNDLLKNPHCKLDPKLYQFIFQQQVHFPHLERYNKVLSDAAVMSRRYLNTIFTRKQYGEINSEDEAMLSIYQEFKNFSVSFRSTREIILITGQQQTLLEDIFSTFREIRGGLGKGLPPVDFVPKRMQIKMVKLQKLIQQGQQAYSRWEVLRETVKQLACNVNRGLHKDHPYYTQKTNQLKHWTQSLMIDMKALIVSGEEIVSDYGKYLNRCKHEQAIWFREQDSVIQQEQKMSLHSRSVLSESDKLTREYDPSDTFKLKSEQWQIAKSSKC